MSQEGRVLISITLHSLVTFTLEPILSLVWDELGAPLLYQSSCAWKRKKKKVGLQKRGEQFTSNTVI